MAFTATPVWKTVMDYLDLFQVVFFTDSTVVNQHVSPPFGRRFLELFSKYFKQIQDYQKGKGLNLPPRDSGFRMVKKTRIFYIHNPYKASYVFLGIQNEKSTF